MNAADLQDAVADLVQWEGSTTWMYSDTRGYVTVGIGNMLPTPQAAQALPFVTRDSLGITSASPAAIAAAWHAVKSAPPAKAAASYATLTTQRLRDQDVTALAVKRLEGEFLPGLRRIFPGFNGYPPAARRALIDMVWNLGVSGLSKFGRLRQAAEARDWTAAAASCSRKTSRPERNDWCRRLFKDAALPGSDDPTAPMRVG